MAALSLPADAELPASLRADKKLSLLIPTPPAALSASQASALAEVEAGAAARWGGDAGVTTWLAETRASFRCLWTHDWDVKKSLANLEATVAWRRATVGPALRCAPCAADPRTHCFVRVGSDRWRRPVVYFAPSRCTSSDLAPTIAHAAAEMEVAFCAPGAAPQWVFVLDLRGVGLFGGYSKSALKDLIAVFTAHYPERLGTMVLIDLAAVVSALFAVIKGLMDPQTVRKIVTVASKEVPAVAAALFGGDETTAAWIVAAVAADAKPGNLPPLPPAAPPPVHALAAAGLTLDTIIARTKAGDDFRDVVPRS